jgi:hypothetical protein
LSPPTRILDHRQQQDKDERDNPHVGTEKGAKTSAAQRL